MTITVKDLDKTEAWSGGAMLPPGKHNVRIDRAEEGTSSGGYDQVEMEFEGENGTGSIRDWLIFTELTLGKARSLLDAVGIEPEGGEWTFPTEQLVDKKLTIIVGEQPDRKDPTKMRRRVFGYDKPGMVSDVPADPIPF